MGAVITARSARSEALKYCLHSDHIFSLLYISSNATYIYILIWRKEWGCTFSPWLLFPPKHRYFKGCNRPLHKLSKLAVTSITFSFGVVHMLQMYTAYFWLMSLYLSYPAFSESSSTKKERLGFRRDHDGPVDLLNNMPNTGEITGRRKLHSHFFIGAINSVLSSSWWGNATSPKA